MRWRTFSEISNNPIPLLRSHLTPRPWVHTRETTVQHNSLVPRPPPSEDEHKGEPGNEVSQCDARASTGWLVTTVSSLTSQPTSTRNGKWSGGVN